MAAICEIIYYLIITLYFSNVIYKGDCSGLGKCPKVEYMTDFNVTQFAGHWYEVERSFYLMEIVSNCVNIDLIQTDSKRLYVSVTSKSSWSQMICECVRKISYLRGICYSWSKSKQRDIVIVRSEGITVSEGVASQMRRDPTLFAYRVSSQLPRMLNKHLPGSGVYQIVDTDYDTYAILYSCADYDLAHSDLLWIWSRQKDLNATLRNNLYQILEAKSLDPDRLILPDNSNCTN